MEENDISVLIVDDSALMRNLIGRIVEGCPGLTVAGKAMNGRFALLKIPRLEPDVMVLDIEMPMMNGIEFLKERRRLGIGTDIPVVILSSIARKGAEITMEALSLGATDFITKPSGSVSEDIHTIGKILVEMLLAYGRQYRRRRARGATGERSLSSGHSSSSERSPSSVTADSFPGPRAAHHPPAVGRSTDAPPSPLHGRPSPDGFSRATMPPAAFDPSRETASRPAPSRLRPLTPDPAREKIEPLRPPGPVEIVVIGISTGGPNALREILPRLLPDLGVPVLVVQHMPPGFTEEFAKSLDRICPLEVKEAGDLDLLRPNRVLIARGDFHLEVEKRSLAAVARLVEGPPVNGHRPSVDVLFDSVARHYGNRTLALIMTGMGRDGAQKIGAIYREGGMTIAQDEQSSIVFGMPKVAIEHGFVHRVLPLCEMAAAINEYVKTGRMNNGQ